MKSKFFVSLALFISTSTFAFNNNYLWTPYDCISNTTFEILFSGDFAFNHQIPPLVAQCEAQGGTLIYFAPNN
ncbi:hypothetical protein [Marinicella sp. W31]|uniref:hypothetical protein n=1 Tax=Marinicella sp. W31 TaxID=3023713 RepID=UPI0037571A27